MDSGANYLIKEDTFMENTANQRRYKKYATSYLFLIPTIAFICTFFYYPVGTALYHGFTRWDLASSTWIGLDNFTRLIKDQLFIVSSLNQLIFTIADVIKNLTFPLLAAELIYLLPGNRWRYFIRTGFIMPMLVPTIVTILLWLSIYNPSYGLLNQSLTLLGLPDAAKPWLAENSTAMWAVILMSFPFISGLYFLIYYAAIGNFNQEIIEAAKIDGATGWKVFQKIHIPLLLPQFKVVAILTIIGSLQDIVKIIVMTGGGPGTATVTPALTMYKVAFASSEYGYASAIGTALFLVIIVVTIFNLKFLKTDY
jgi:raffinose/stachyose/melibiose transport system permease protein